MSTEQQLYPPKIDNILPAFSSEETFFEIGVIDTEQDNNCEIPYQQGKKYSYKKGNYFYYKNNNDKYVIDNGNAVTENRIYFDKLVTIKFPYWLNPTVGKNDFTHIYYVIKSTTTNSELLSGKIDKGVWNPEKKQYLLTLQVPQSLFSLGQYYKIQIAFWTETLKIGYYSNASIIKYISEPEITITQKNLKEVIGKYKDALTYEKVYSYSFDLYDNNNILVESSGIQLHNTSNDTSSSTCTDTWQIQTSLEADVPYTIKYSVTTVNKYTSESEEVELEYYDTIAPRIEGAVLKVKNIFEEGYNQVYLYRNIPTQEDLSVRGNFYLLRASHKDNYTQWDKIADFQIYNWKYSETKPNFEIYKDYFIEQGVNYRYAIQAYSKAKRDGEKIQYYSAKLMNEEGPIHSDFEDIFLYDGERQLKIRFNPKIGSFKSTILENKIDTIGSKYPYFFRNGNVNYKEFNLSGLISMTGNNNNEFLFDEKKYCPTPELVHVDTELSSYNYQKEREFKLEVLSWLTNGKEKILKAPAEGNYIVRLMNTSLTPNDTLGRMLHTFTSTIYEIANYDFVTLASMGFLEKANKIPRFEKTKKLKEKSSVNNGNYELEFSSNLIVDRAIIYTSPNKTINYKINGDSNSYSKTSDEYGIINLSTEISETGLSLLISDSWDISDTVVYSYLNKVNNINEWYWAYDISKSTFSFSNESGLGTSVSMKKQINQNNITKNGNVITQTAIARFPYIEIRKKDVIEIYKTDNVYQWKDGSTLKNINQTFLNAYPSSNYIFKIKDTDIYVLITTKNNVLQYKEVREDSGVFWVITETEKGEDLTYLGNLVNSNQEKKVFRDLQDFKLGQGLKATGTSPSKQITARNNTTYSYAI